MLTIDELTEQLHKESRKQRWRVRQAASEDRLRRVAKVILEQSSPNFVVGAADDEDPAVDSAEQERLQQIAIRNENLPVGSLLSSLAVWAIESLIVWAVRRGLQIWKQRRARRDLGSPGAAPPSLPDGELSDA